MLVAAYSALLLAGIQTFGDVRSDAFPALPKWRRNARRPSCLDLITVLRKEVVAANQSQSIPTDIDWRQLLLTAAA